LCRSLVSPGGHPASEYGAEPATPVKSAFGIAMCALVGQPMPSSHCACTRNVLPGSNSAGRTWLKVPAAYATVAMIARRANVAVIARSFIEDEPPVSRRGRTLALAPPLGGGPVRGSFGCWVSARSQPSGGRQV